MNGTAFTRLFGADADSCPEAPIIQAPMAGGITTVELIGAVCDAGGLGSLGAGAMSADAIIATAAAIRRRTARPFGINLFVLEPVAPDMTQVLRAVALLAPLRIRLGLEPWQPPSRYCEDFAAQFAALVACAPPLASFTMGILTRPQVAALQSAGSLVMGTATNVAEARAWQAVGADCVCVQGAEAGGHRGTFIGRCEDSLTGLVALVPQVVSAVTVPVVAAGGMMNGAGVAAALMLGAQAAQLGTAFLVTDEARIAPPWRARLLAAVGDETCVTRVFSGRGARALRNAFVDEFESVAAQLPDYPVHNALTQPIRAAAAQAGDAELLSMWAGQGAALCRPMGAAQLLQTLVRECDAALPV